MKSIEFTNHETNNVENITTLKNAVVLMYQTGKARPVTHIFAFDGVKDNKEVTLIQRLLVACLADYNAVHGQTNEFSQFIVNGQKQDSGLKFTSVLKPYLRTSVIWKTDSDGKLSKAISLDNGLQLKDTFFAIKESHTLTKCQGRELKAALYNQSKAILSQFSMIDLVNQEIDSILANLAKVKESIADIAKPKTAKPKTARVKGAKALETVTAETDTKKDAKVA